MKKIGFLFVFLIGTTTVVFSQEKNEENTKADAKNADYSNLFQHSQPLELKIPESLLIDSTHVFIPRSLFTERRLTLATEPKFRVGLPFVELPDPQSRMPIREFDDSVNYTILKKEY